MRAQLATRSPARAHVDWPAFPEGLHTALTAYEAALGRQPWLDYWPLGASGLTIERLSANQLALADAGGRVLPLERAQTDALTPMLGLRPLSGLFTWDGWSATLLAAETPIGRWHEG